MDPAASIDGPGLARGVEPTVADARSRMAPRDEDQAAEPPAGPRAADGWHEVR
jgi:hypothetical protein